MLDRLALFFRENWRQMLVIAIAVALPSSLALSGSDRKYGYLITDTIFVMGAFFFLASQIGKWGKILMHMFFAFTLFDFGLSFGSYLANCQFVTIDTFYLILGTNKEEASEFFEFYFPLWKVLLWAGAMLLVCILYICKRPKLQPSMKVSRVSSIVFLAVAV